MRFIAAVACLLVSTAAGAWTLEFTIQPTRTDEAGATLPTSGPGSLTSHRIEYGTCNGAAFGVAIGSQVVAMPAVTGAFRDVPVGLYCLRAFAANAYGEGRAYPVSSVGPLPSGDGLIAVIRASSP